ncbi:MAG TPA: hypothetical protein VII83_08620 [Gaiellaceae bacterium]
MTDLDFVVIPGRGAVFVADLKREAEKAVEKGRAFGMDADTCYRVLESGESIAHYAAFKNVETAGDFQQARERLAAWEKGERDRQQAEWETSG